MLRVIARASVAGRAAPPGARPPMRAAPRARSGEPRQTWGMTTSGSAARAGSTRQRPVVVPELERARLAQPLDAAPAAADPDLDVAVEGDEPLAVAGIERLAAADPADSRAPARVGQRSRRRAAGRPSPRADRPGGAQSPGRASRAQPTAAKHRCPGEEWRRRPTSMTAKDDALSGISRSATSSARSATRPPLARTRSSGVIGKDRVGQAGGRPQRGRGRARSRSTRTVRATARGRMAGPRRWRSRSPPRASSPSARRTPPAPSRRPRELAEVDAVRARDERDDGRAAGNEDERLHDLGHLAADGARRIGGRARALREALDLDLEAGLAGSGDHAVDVRVHRPIIGRVLG